MKQNSTSTLAALTRLVSGLKKNQPKGLFLLAGSKYTANQLVTILQSIITALQAVPVAKGTYQKTIKSSDALLEQHHAVIVQLKQSLQMQADADTELLADYGLTPRKPNGIRTPKVNVAAADKAKATRAARHTMGSKQKREITGATVAAAATAQALAAAGVTSAVTPSGVTVGATPPVSGAATGTPIVAAPLGATPVVTPGH